MSLGTFFPEQKYISMLEMLTTVDQTTDFLDEFVHWQIKYQRSKPAKKVFFAGIIGYGCDIGHRKLAQISKQIDEGELDNTVNWYFSLQNIQGANDRILQFTDRLNLPNIYRRDPDVLHTSSDGQKFEVAVDSLNANYSFKYLGKDKGVSVVTFIDTRDLIWHSSDQLFRTRSSLCNRWVDAQQCNQERRTLHRYPWVLRGCIWSNQFIGI